ncbi:MAG: beta-propeller fold lactonase family protein [Gammaproteobacteria bacterium]|nr:beta-propeller fold lactonase family protein [Gammaproteobacteria bacterium]MDH3507075.1 beta-propeller fold lactonase family protein [Gammaproteobacteria bacterium]
MQLHRLIPAALVVSMTPALAQQSSPTLDFEYFKAYVQPVYTTKRDGNARCISCHAHRDVMHLEPPAEGSAAWSEASARANFAIASAYVVPGKPEQSRMLLHPLAEEAGGDPHHDGGKHWASKDDPEWQRLAAWVRGATLDSAPMTAALKPRIIQTNSAGDNVHIIDAATNRVVGEIHGIEVGHGAAAAPDGSRLYFSNEAEATLDVVDGQTLRIMAQIPLTGRPNNISSSPDGRRVYVAIREGSGAVDIIDTLTLTNAKSVPVDGGVHNTFTTPDGRYVIAGTIVGKNATVIDAATEEVVWTKYFDLGVRPIAFSSNADGSTHYMFVQLSGFNGFAVIDFETHEEVARIELPKIAPGKEPVLTGGNESHGMAVTSDNSVLVVDSRLNSAVYMYSLPDLTLLGSVDVGTSPDWVTLTPDGRTAYVANAGSNDVSVVDIHGRREITRIPVGQVPKRNITAMMPELMFD